FNQHFPAPVPLRLVIDSPPKLCSCCAVKANSEHEIFCRNPFGYRNSQKYTVSLGVYVCVFVCVHICLNVLLITFLGKCVIFSAVRG
uniref:Uncharacterized protein n=1 Tax=Scleropages formosus TaxID=113540 RepID=A0A8C9SVR8_SCLFO